MDSSDFILLLARQRSGTNPLRDVLATHPRIFCTPEVFHNEPSPSAELEVETNFFNFLEQHPLGTVKRSISMEAQGRLFLDFLEYLRCFTDKRYVLLDVKYNSTHHLDGPWREIAAQPDLFRFIKRHRVRVLNLTRHNALRSHLSLLKANLTNTWTVESGASGPPPDQQVVVDTAEMLHVLRMCRAEDELIDRSFEAYEPYLTFDYEELFPELGGRPSAAVLERVSNWLGIDPEFRPSPKYRKQSALTLEETIANHDEVVQALAGTALESCLEDERMYRAQRADQTRDPRRGASQRRTGARQAHAAADRRASRVNRRRGGRAMELTEVMGCAPDEFSDRLYHRRPGWVEGIVSHFDARYLFGRALESRTNVIVEIGTASGVSTAFLCHALDVASRAGAIGGDFEVRSHDLQPRFYGDESKQVGDATREMLPAELMRHITFRAPATSLTVADEFTPDSISFMFVDANHAHPWPTLDLLATLDSLLPGAEVVLHDINLPVRESEAAGWGAKHVFDGLDLEKRVDPTDPIPNIGSVWIPADKEAVRQQLLAIVSAHEWQTEVWDEVTARVLS